jgi:hypothetical protein
MFLATVKGRYWVELVDPVTADWESLRMNHGIAATFREMMRNQAAVSPGERAEARFFSLRDRNADPVSTAMTYKGRVKLGLARSSQSPFPEFAEDYRILADRLGVEFSTSCYPHRQVGFRV